VIREAVLDANTTEAETSLVQAEALGQFGLLSDNDWDKPLFTKIYNMNISGETSGIVPSTAQGKPKNLLVQTTAGKGVGSIEIRKLTLKVRTDGVILDTVYSNGNAVVVSGNKITFTNADYGSGAALYTFPENVLPLNNKKVTFSYKIDSFQTGKSYQIHIQAANGKFDYNGRHPSDSNGNIGQFYRVLDAAEGSFDVNGTELQNATAYNSSSESQSSGNNFPLTAVRIVNNGKNESTELGQTEKTYELIFNSITVK
jgi:hypothetical protein